MDATNVSRPQLTQGASIVAPGVSPERAAAALRKALTEAPRTYGVSWFDGAYGPRAASATHDWPTLAAELVARLALPMTKGTGDALLPAITDPDRTDKRRGAIVSVTFAHVDHDGGATTLGEARATLAAVGLGAFLFPSPSAPRGPVDRVTRWRCLIPLASGTAAADYALAAAVVRDAFAALFGQGVDRSTYRPECLAYVHPRETIGPRSPESLVCVDGLALDVAALADAATLAGWWNPDAARGAARAGVRDGAALAAVWRAAGYVDGAASPAGWTPLRCPRASWHGSHGPARRDTSTAIHEQTGACVCAHDHSLGPADERGRANTSTMLRWLREDHPELVADVALARDAGQLGEVAADLATVPYGEAPRRVVHLAAAADDMADAAALAVRAGKIVVYTPTVGTGKTRGTGATLAPLVRDVALQPDEDARAPLASAGVCVRDRDAIPDVVASLLAAGLPVRVHTPAHEVMGADGAPSCIHRPRALRVYEVGGSARASLCPSVPGASGACAPCVNHDTCPARAPWVPWRIGPDGKPRAESWHTPEAGEAWVAVTTHATPAPLRQGALLVVDEADVALQPVVSGLTVQGIQAALAWAEILAPVRVRGDHEPSAAPRIIGRAIARSAYVTPLEYLAAVPPEARLGWCVLAVMHDPEASTPAALHDLARWARVDPDGSDPKPVVRAAVAHWIAQDANAHAVSLRWRRPLPETKADPLRALARWAGGCHARYVADGDDGPVMALAWPSRAAAACVAALARGGGVLALDATGDPAIARAAVGHELVHHDPVRVDGGANVHRVHVHTRRAGRRALAPRGGAVDWNEHVLPALRGALGALRASWRKGRGIGEGIVFAPRQLALACAALAAVGVEGDDDAVRAEVERRCDVAKVSKISDGPRARILAWALAADDTTRRLVDELGAHGDVRWAYYGSTEARGSNDHKHRAWSVTLGDARPSAEATRDALWSGSGVEPTRDAVKRAMARAAAAAHEQAHGRLRALRREGAELVHVHVGSVPPLGWYELPEVPRVVSLAGAWQMGRDPVAAALPVSADDVVAVAGDAVALPSRLAALDVHRAHAAGWTLADVALAAGVDRNTARVWWRGERAPTKARHVDALRALADGSGAPTVRAALRRLTDGRGWSTVWRGARGAMGLVQRLASLGVLAAADDVERWTLVPSAELPPEVVGAIAAVLPELVRVFPPARPMPAVVASWPPAEAPGAVPMLPAVPVVPVGLPLPLASRGRGGPRRALGTTVPRTSPPKPPLRETG